MLGRVLQPHLRVEERGRVDERVAVDAAEAGEGRVLQPRDHAEHVRLRAVFHLRLEAHDIVKRAQRVVAPQLHDGMGLYVGLVRVGQAHGFHRPVAQGLAPALGHHLDGQAAVEI
jgi:hypothetical protein